MSWFPLLSPPAQLIAYQHNRGWGKSSFMFDIYIAYLSRKQCMLKKSSNLLLEYNSFQLLRKIHSWVFIMSYNMTISPYLCTCCSVLTARLSNLTKFQCPHRRDAVIYTHVIFHNKCKKPRHSTWKFSNIYFKNKYHHLTLHKFRLLLNKGVHALILQKLRNCQKKSILSILSGGNYQFVHFVSYLWMTQHVYAVFVELLYIMRVQYFLLTLYRREYC